MREPGLFGPVILSLGAAACFSLARFGVSWSDLARSLLVIAGVILALAAVLMGGDWLAARYAARLYSVRMALSITPASRLAAELRGLPGEAVLEIIRRNPGALEVDTIPGPGRFLVVDDERIPQPFVEEWLDLARGDRLPAVRRWSDSRKRDWARALTLHLSRVGWAEIWGPNEPAKLVNGRSLADVATYFGL